MQKDSLILGQLLPASLPNWVVNEVKAAPWEVCFSKGYEHLVYSDVGQPIVSNRVTFTPREMALILAYLEPKSTDNVLEIGSSVMRLTSIFAKICCSVYNVESDAERYKDDMAIADLLNLRNFKGFLGHYGDVVDSQKFSIIMVNIPMAKLDEGMFDLLSDNGRMCLLQGEKEPQRLTIYNKTKDGVEEKVVLETFLNSIVNNEFIF